MKVSEYIDFLIIGDCSKLAIIDVGDMAANPSTTPTDIQLVNQGKFISYINLANLALHKRYALLKKEIQLDNPVDGEEYTLPTNFLAPVYAYYAVDFDAVNIKDEARWIIDDIDTAVSIMIPEPFLAKIKGTDTDIDVLKRNCIILEYAAAPTKATVASTNLKISETYTEALLHYAAYKAHSTIDGDMKAENNTYYLRYEAACKQLVNSGMGGDNQMNTNTKLEDRGFV